MTEKKDQLIDLVNREIEKYLVSKNEKFRDKQKNCLSEDDVVSFCVQTIKQRLTQRRKGKEDRETYKYLKQTHPELFNK